MVGQEIEKNHKNNWKFINSGFNLRPTDICINWHWSITEIKSDFEVLEEIITI